MKFKSSFAAALALGAASLAVIGAAAPAAAKKEEKAASAEGKPKPSKNFAKAYNESVAVVEAGEAGAIKAKADALRALVSNEDDKYMLGVYLFNGGAKNKDGAMASEGLTLMAASPLPNAASKANYIYQKGAVLYDWSKDYAGAAAAFEESYNAGKRDNSVEFNTANAYALAGDNVKATMWMERAIEAKRASGEAVEDNWYRLLASNANKADNPAVLNAAMRKILGWNPEVNYWHDAVVLMSQNYTLNNQEYLDALRLLRKTGALKSPRLYADYAEMADARRYPAEVVSVLQEGISKGVISRSDVTFKDYLAIAEGRAGSVGASWAQDEAEAKASAKGYLAMLTGDAMFSAGQYAKAEAMYQLALDKGNVVDSDGANQAERALTRLAMAQMEQSKYADAKASLAKLTGTNRKEIGALWAVYIDGKMAQ